MAKKKLKKRAKKQKAKVNAKLAKLRKGGLLGKRSFHTIRTKAPVTWCPGCFNNQILLGVEKFLANKDPEKEKFAIVSGIGCHAKIFDYINLPGINALHGRTIPTALGIKTAKPELNVLAFSGDADGYSEGIEHLISAARYNLGIKYLVHNNQVLALTLAQPTPTTEKGYKDKTTPFGVKLKPMNPIKLMLASGASFVARVFADSEQVKNILEEAQKHKGFAFIEILQPCIVFHPDIGYKDKTYNLQKMGHDKTNYQEAMKKAEEFDYNGIKGSTKIPVGIFYQADRPVFEEIARERK